MTNEERARRVVAEWADGRINGDEFGDPRDAFIAYLAAAIADAVAAERAGRDQIWADAKDFAKDFVECWGLDADVRADLAARVDAFAAALGAVRAGGEGGQ